MKIRLLSLTLLMLLVALSFSPASADNTTWLIYLTFSNTASVPRSVADTFGTGLNYTACIDKNASLPYSETEQPPLPPAGVIDARFYDDLTGSAECLGQGVKTNIHAGSTAVAVTDTFEFQIQVADKNNPWFITWDTTDIHKKASSMVMQDAVTGAIVDVDMMATDSIKITKTSAAKNMTQFLIYVTWTPIDPTYTGTGVVERQGTGLPTQFALNQNYPNPFNPTTTLSFSIVKSAFTEVTVYNILGQKVANLVGQQLTPGTYTTKWNGTDDHGMAVSSGVYFVRMTANSVDAAANFTAMKKILLMK